jgi:hypothetical protein
MLYETVPLFLVPRTFVESALLVGLSYAQHFLAMPQDIEHWALSIESSGRWIAVLLYVPVTIMILRRPNVGVVPRPVERIANWLSSFTRFQSAH